MTARASARLLVEIMTPTIWDDLRQRQLLFILTVMALLSGLMGLVWPLATRTAIDLLVEASWGRFLIYCGLLAGAVASQATVSYLSTRLSANLVYGLVRSLRERSYTNHLLLAAIGPSDTGDSLVTINGDCGRVGSLTIGIISSVSVTLLSFLGTVVAMALMSPPLLLLSILPAILLAWLYATHEPSLVAGSQRQRVAAGRLSAIVKDHLDNARVLRGLRGEASSVESVGARLEDCMGAGIGLAFIQARLQFIASGVLLLGQLLVLVYSGALLLAGSITLGTVFAFGTLFSRLLGPVGALWGLRNTLNTAAPSIERVHRSLFRDQMAELPQTIADIDRLIDRVRSEFASGCTIALTGPVGAGKSTLCLALMIKSWRGEPGNQALRAVLYLPQNAQLPRGTVRSILTMGLRAAPSDAQLAASLSAVFLSQRMRLLQHGLDTEIGPGGTDFSAGETQQLFLARTLLDDYDLLILDEATSSLDPETALAILKHLKQRVRLSRGRLLVVTHQQAEVDLMDRHVRLEGGQLYLRDVKSEVPTFSSKAAGSDLEF